MAELRPERPGEEAGVRRVHELAFGRSDEADIVDALRGDDAFLPELSLVAVDDGDVVGHCLLSRAGLGERGAALLLAPLGVVPERQGEGLGSELVREALRRAERMDLPFVVVVGEPGFYRRLGFVEAGPRGVEAPFALPVEAWMLFPLPRYDPALRGRVAFAPVFEPR